MLSLFAHLTGLVRSDEFDESLSEVLIFCSVSHGPECKSASLLADCPVC